MEEITIIEMFATQKEVQLGLWKSLLTVGLAVIAYFGAMQNRISRKVAITLACLYIAFAISNFRAMCKVFQLRDVLSDKYGKEIDPCILSALVPSEGEQTLNYIFHVVVDLGVVAAILVFSGLVLGPNKPSKRDAVTGTSS